MCLRVKIEYIVRYNVNLTKKKKLRFSSLTFNAFVILFYFINVLRRSYLSQSVTRDVQGLFKAILTSIFLRNSRHFKLNRCKQSGRVYTIKEKQEGLQDDLFFFYFTRRFPSFEIIFCHRWKISRVRPVCSRALNTFPIEVRRRSSEERWNRIIAAKMTDLSEC